MDESCVYLLFKINLDWEGKKMFENWLCPSDDDESEFETSDSEYDNTASETVSELSAEIEDIPKVKENGNGKAHEGVGIF